MLDTFKKIFDFLVAFFRLLIFICLLPVALVFIVLGIFTGNDYEIVDRILEFSPV